MKIQEAIQLAVESGYPTWKLLVYPGEEATGISYTTWLEMQYGRTFLDPIFWQALGKSLGWDGEVEVVVRSDGESIKHEEHLLSKWAYHQYRLISHLQDGKNIESFFESLT